MTTEEIVAENFGIKDVNMEKMLKEYAEQKCKKQREIIAKGLPDRCFVDIDEGWIMSMESPEFE